MTPQIKVGRFIAIRNINKLVAKLISKYSTSEAISILINKYGLANASSYVEPQQTTADTTWFDNARAKYKSFKNKNCPTCLKLIEEYNLRKATLCS